MLHFENAPKKATNLSLAAARLEKPRELGMNKHQICPAWARVSTGCNPW